MGFGAFNIAVSGLRSHNTMLQVAGNNIANLNTPGFKRSRAHFSDFMEVPIACGNLRVGGGVRVDSVDRVFTQGPLTQTSRPLDLALQGEGFFAVDVGGVEHYTRDGAFDFDAQGTLRHISSGGEVLDTNGKPLTAPISLVNPPKATTSVDVTGNFDANSNGPIAEILSSRAPLATPSGPATLSTNLNDLTANTTDYVPGDTITISGKDKDGNPISANFVYGGNTSSENGTTVGDLINFINGSGTGPNGAGDKFPDATLSLSPTGHLVLAADTPGAANLELTLADGLTKSNGTPQTGQTSFQLHTLEETVAGADPNTFSTTIEIFGKNGASHQLNLEFTKTGQNTWDMVGTVAGTTMIDNQVTGIRFNKDGSFGGVTGTGNGDGNLTFQEANCPPVTVDLNFGRPGSFNGATQFGGYSDATASDQNGYPRGDFESVNFDENGDLVVTFTNAQTEKRGKLKVVNFQNPEGMREVGRNLFVKSPSSGPPMQGALQSGATRVMPHYLEGSNVDQTQELTNLIIAQNGFAANSRTITVSQQMFDVVNSLVR